MVTTIRVSETTRATLKELAAEVGAPMHEVAAQAIELYRRQRLLEATNAAYAALRDDPAAWAEVTEEQDAWDATVGDGLVDPR